MGWDNLMEGAGLGWVPVPVPVQFPLEGPGPGDFSGTRYLLRRSVIVDPGLGKRRPKEDREAGRRRRRPHDGFFAREKAVREDGLSGATGGLI